ncbi:hypothetical protein RM704_00885 [Streptomyces sp. DSM 3412]|uniref:Uncharacterized protein n=1 Tax=Streptomyces gottesmaniae TaxID=3075518 RepID=A0ABU2YNZ4_9ACTN|nr:hypothetical protein [Streptomyces sp. DSM 3412]MDT0566053.1 hypothetical protein [Streptomyces sp. DSM 3412]
MTSAHVRACAGDAEEWRKRWQEAAELLGEVGPGPEAEVGPAPRARGCALSGTGLRLPVPRLREAAGTTVVVLTPGARPLAERGTVRLGASAGLT